MEKAEKGPKEIGVGGVQPSTNDGRSAAIKTFNQFVCCELPLQGFTAMPEYEDISEDDVCCIRTFRQFGAYLVSLSSEAEVNENRKPSGLEQTMISFKNAVFRKYPNNSIWIDQA